MSVAKETYSTHEHRRNPGDLEVGATDVLRRHPTAHLAVDHAAAVPQWVLNYERARPQLLREMIAEAAGVFCYVYCGVSATATFVLTTVAGQAGYGSLLNIAFGFGFGIAFALITSASTSGGHFNPAMTLVFAVFQGFPLKKVPIYIFSQCFGAFMACAIIYAQWNQEIKAYGAGLKLLGEPLISATGPASIFIAIPQPTQNMGSLFLSEFFTDSFLGLIIWAVFDSNNPFISPVSAPFTIGLAYFVMILGFGANTLSTNLARDLGARCFAACLYGKEVFTIHNHYPAISILVNIPATFLGVLFYQMNMGDSYKMINRGHALHADVHRVLTQERAQAKANGTTSAFEQQLKQKPEQRGLAQASGAQGSVDNGIKEY